MGLIQYHLAGQRLHFPKSARAEGGGRDGKEGEWEGKGAKFYCKVWSLRLYWEAKTSIDVESFLQLLFIPQWQGLEVAADDHEHSTRTPYLP
jgi:hypothetical protein